MRTPDGTRWRLRYEELGRRTAKQRLTEAGEVAEGGDHHLFYENGG